jgi:hypothetical protein
MKTFEEENYERLLKLIEALPESALLGLIASCSTELIQRFKNNKKENIK